MATNPNCDGGRCTREEGEVRVLPLGSEPDHGNLILCRRCHAYEMDYRRERNRNLEEFAKFDLPTWDELKVYGAD